MSLILGIESTCDETAAAVVRDGRVVLSSVVATQFELHGKFRGVVPEIATRAHVERMMPVVMEACEGAGLGLDGLDGVAVAQRPGLIGSLLIGVTAAKTLAWLLHRPLLGVDHVQAHLYSVLLDGVTEPEFPAVGAVLSGGHTALYRMRSFTELELIGSTIDDAVGEAYDKVAAMLGLAFPGGPELDKLAGEGDAGAVVFPRTLLEKDSLDFSFSGLKTAVRYHAFGHKGTQRTVEELTAKEKRDIAASFQAAVLDVLVTKLRRAADVVGARSFILGGGVTRNRGLRERLGGMKLPVYLPEPKYCTDNAAMIAGLGELQLRGGNVSGLDMDAVTASGIPAGG
jgi:N6-L-threonylcarbamoyladenine synthase